MTIFRFLLLLLFLPSATCNYRNVLIARASKRLVRLISNFLNVNLKGLRISAIYDCHSNDLLAAKRNLRRGMCRYTRQGRCSRQGSVLKLFRVGLGRKLSLFLVSLAVFSDYQCLEVVHGRSSQLFANVTVVRSDS